MAAGKLWSDAYRPSTLSEYVFKDTRFKTQLEEIVKNKSFGHMLFSGSSGIGKSTIAKILINECEVNDLDVLEINASRTNSVDDIRDTITNFIQTIPFGDFKVVLLDECLDENTLVTVLRNSEEVLIPIKDLDDKNDLVKSYNVTSQRIEWKPFTLFNKGLQDVMEIEFEDGSVVICTPDHKWYVEDNNGGHKVIKASELYEHMHILT